ncbi:MAG: HEAT repeat domain-containing protein, partial [Planctomycetota bacterium]
PFYWSPSIQAQDTAESGFEKVEENQTEPSEAKEAEVWLARLRSNDIKIRLPAIYALKTRVSITIPVLLRALRDQDKTVRRIAAETLVRIYNPYPKCNYDKPEGAWHNPSELHWADWTVPGKIHAVIPALSYSLSDEFEEVRAYSAIALFKLAPFAEVAHDELEAACNDSSPVVRFWAEAAVDRINQKRWDSLRLLAQNLQGNYIHKESLTQAELDDLVECVRTGPGWEFDDPRFQVVNPYGTGPRYVWPEEEDQRWNATLKVINCEFPNLISAVEGEDPKAAAKASEILDLLQWALDKRLWVLMRFVDEDFDPCCAPAMKELMEMGVVAFPALEYDYLRYHRFPIGAHTYIELVSILKQQGATALPILVKGLEHWMKHEVYNVAEVIHEMGPEALPAIPFFLTLWRYSSNKDGLGNDSFWDGISTGWKKGDSAIILASMGPGALPWLESALKDDLYNVRVRACRNIAAVGEDAACLLPSLAALLEDRYYKVRHEAARAILDLAPENDPRVSRAENVLKSLNIRDKEDERTRGN